MDWQRTKCGTTAAPASQATMQRCMAVPHPHFDSDDEDLFPVPGKLKLLAGQGGAAAKADEDSEDELSPASSPWPRKRSGRQVLLGGVALVSSHVTLMLRPLGQFKTQRSPFVYGSQLTSSFERANKSWKSALLQLSDIITTSQQWHSRLQPSQTQIALPQSQSCGIWCAQRASIRAQSQHRQQSKKPIAQFTLALAHMLFPDARLHRCALAKIKNACTSQGSQITVYVLFSLMHGTL